MNQNDCQKCGGWGCPVCTLKGVGEQADPELDELSRLRARVRHLEERLAVEKTSAEAWVALGAADEREALISLIQNAGERQWGGWDPGLIAAIRARSGKALNRLEGVK